MKSRKSFSSIIRSFLPLFLIYFCPSFTSPLLLSSFLYSILPYFLSFFLPSLHAAFLTSPTFGPFFSLPSLLSFWFLPFPSFIPSLLLPFLLPNLLPFILHPFLFLLDFFPFLHRSCLPASFILPMIIN